MESNRTEILKTLLHPSDVEFPADDEELVAELSFAFKYGLAVGIYKPIYAMRLLKILSLENDYWFEEFLAKGRGEEAPSIEEVYNSALQDIQSLVDEMEKKIPMQE